ncbi:hypothetical protein GCM10010112_34990 [Actinoplanes lobatus]|uniref:Uncharacterized protein n=2 Tax=Actinoplanes lobatus TaxID=113568 RepID=A0ABQ4AT19_9ACTN|nr:hypothetical protein GCM10010112_34990 [Actinoplanes lobatus]GIE44141.1 hypothetical protein Alo02nite_70390 [Actinoplanes lobatus]
MPDDSAGAWHSGAMANPSDDPHIHVEAGALRSRAAERNMLAATFGLAAQLPAEVPTACGRRVPYAMTSTLPESVTCLPCREHAGERHRRFADQVEALGPGPGSPFSDRDAATSAAAHRDIARRFAS